MYRRTSVEDSIMQQEGDMECECGLRLNHLHVILGTARNRVHDDDRCRVSHIRVLIKRWKGR